VVKIQPPLDAGRQMVIQPGPTDCDCHDSFTTAGSLGSRAMHFQETLRTGISGVQAKEGTNVDYVYIIALLDTRYRFGLFCFLPIGTCRK
jgi:hypothetical protein